MGGKFDIGGGARAAFFTLLPAAATAGAMALPALIAAAGALSIRPSQLRQHIEFSALWTLLLLAFTAWAAASTAWSSYADHAQAPKLAATIVLGLAFAAAASATMESRRLTCAAALAAFTVLALLLAVEALGRLPLNRAMQPDQIYWLVERNPARGVVVLLGLVWPVAGAALGAGRPQLAMAALFVGGFFAFQFDQAANVVAYGFGLGGFILASMAPRFAILLVSGGLAAWMLAAPFATPLLLANPALLDRLPPSLAARAGIWDYVCQRIAEQPWIGRGLDASRTVTDTIMVRGVEMPAIQLHPHSASLQIWFETGLVGAALAALAILAGGWAASRALARRPFAAAGACATLAAYGLIANVSFGAWQEWWNASILLAGAVAAAFATRALRDGR